MARFDETVCTAPLGPINVCTQNVKRGVMQNLSGLYVPKPIDVKSKGCMSVAQLAKKYNKHEMCTCVQRVNCVCPLKARRPVIGRRRSSKTSHWTRHSSVYTDISSPSNSNFSRTNVSVSEPGNSTPIKRKLWRESKVKDLISTYDDIAQLEGESPAKRARLGRQGS